MVAVIIYRKCVFKKYHCKENSFCEDLGDRFSPNSVGEEAEDVSLYGLWEGSLLFFFRVDFFVTMDLSGDGLPSIYFILIVWFFMANCYN